MKTCDEYLRHADECDALVRKATSPDQREMIEQMAGTWRMLAAQRETLLRKRSEEAALRSEQA